MGWGEGKGGEGSRDMICILGGWGIGRGMGMGEGTLTGRGVISWGCCGLGDGDGWLGCEWECEWEYC